MSSLSAVSFVKCEGSLSIIDAEQLM